MSDILKTLEYAKIIAKKVFAEDYTYSSDSRQMAIRNVLLAVRICNDPGDLEAIVNQIKDAVAEKPQEKQPEKPKSTKLVRG